MRTLECNLRFSISVPRVAWRNANGPRIRSDRFSEEQRSSLVLLFDQFAATLFNRVVEQDRLRAERQAAQQEKLAVIGLMAGSLAHEIRNPLSSIRTVASLLREDLGTHSDHAKDVEIILEEIDRLTQTTQRLLDFAKPANDQLQHVDVHQVATRLFHLLAPWSAQQQVTLETRLHATSSLVRATDAAVSEILLNILRNAIEATRASSNARVQVETMNETNFLIVRVTTTVPASHLPYVILFSSPSSPAKTTARPWSLRGGRACSNLERNNCMLS